MDKLVVLGPHLGLLTTCWTYFMCKSDTENRQIEGTKWFEVQKEVGMSTMCGICMQDPSACGRFDQEIT